MGIRLSESETLPAVRFGPLEYPPRYICGMSPLRNPLEPQNLQGVLSRMRKDPLRRERHPSLQPMRLRMDTQIPIRTEEMPFLPFRQMDAAEDEHLLLPCLRTSVEEPFGEPEEMPQMPIDRLECPADPPVVRQMRPQMESPRRQNLCEHQDMPALQIPRLAQTSGDGGVQDMRTPVHQRKKRQMPRMFRIQNEQGRHLRILRNVMAGGRRPAGHMSQMRDEQDGEMHRSLVQKDLPHHIRGRQRFRIRISLGRGHSRGLDVSARSPQNP